MNLFSSALFLEAYGAAYYPATVRRVSDFDVAGRRLRTLLLNEARPLCAGPFFDFLQPLEETSAAQPARPLQWVPHTVLHTEEITSARPAPGAGQPSPYVAWGRFPRWEDFTAFAAERRSGLWSDSRRKWRKLERDLGPVVFRYHDLRPEAFEQCLAWKSAQYRRSNLPDRFGPGQPGRTLFQALMAAGGAVHSTLTAGETLVSAHLGGVWNRRFYWWVPTYDPARAQYSPGRLLLQALLEASFRQGDQEFDLLIGDEDYKFHYATDNRVIGEVGTPPRPVRLERKVRAAVRSAVRPFPRVLAWSRWIRSRL
jgi:CelD/BcsL family acetyltransferase involved in cellulose biosynthesis